jgi:putative ABC transport system permease protein
VHAGHRSRRIGLTGVTPDAHLQRVVDTTSTPVALPAAGLVLSRALADVLGVRAGDRVDIAVLEGRRPRRTVQVSALVDDYLGISAYMDLAAVHALMREAGVLSGAHVLVDRAHEAELYARLKTLPAVGAVARTQAALDSFQKQMDETMGVLVAFNVLFASTIAFGVLYNAARISLSERSRELASLRVLGFTRAEISSILLGELALLTLAGIPLGLLMGVGFASLILRLFQTELYRFPVLVGSRTFAFAALVTLGAAVISALIVRRRLDRLDLVAVLKSRE